MKPTNPIPNQLTLQSVAVSSSSILLFSLLVFFWLKIIIPVTYLKENQTIVQMVPLSYIWKSNWANAMMKRFIFFES